MSRPGFLAGSIPLYLVGVATAYHAGYGLRVLALLLGLATVWAVQAMTHFNNEYWDVLADEAADGPSRISGGSRILVDGLVPRRAARIAALSSLGLALLLAVTVLLRGEGGGIYLGIVSVAVVCGWLYSSPPVRFVARGVGEVVVAVVAGALVPAVGYLLQTPTLDRSIVSVALPLVPLAFATSVATAVPDTEADRVTGKRTLPVRVGVRRSVVLAGVALVFGWLLFGRAVSDLWSGRGYLAFLVVLVPLFVFSVDASAVMGGATARAERLAVVVMVILGWVAFATSALLFLG